MEEDVALLMELFTGALTKEVVKMHRNGVRPEEWGDFTARAADLVVADTNAHAAFFRRRFGLVGDRVEVQQEEGTEGGGWTIEEVHERHSALLRRAVLLNAFPFYQWGAPASWP